MLLHQFKNSYPSFCQSCPQPAAQTSMDSISSAAQQAGASTGPQSRAQTPGFSMHFTSTMKQSCEDTCSGLSEPIVGYWALLQAHRDSEKWGHAIWRKKSPDRLKNKLKVVSGDDAPKNEHSYPWGVLHQEPLSVIKLLRNSPVLAHVLLDVSQAPWGKAQLWLLQICIAKKENTLLDHVGLAAFLKYFSFNNPLECNWI